MMKRAIEISLIIILITSITSCGQITKKVKDKVEDTIDSFFPVFDAYNSDTKSNKKRFKDFLKVEINPTVKNIYCFNDDIGIDVDYMFAFNCDFETSRKIIKIHTLNIDTINLDNGFNIQHDFEWWDKTRIKELQKYSWTNEEGYYKYYWYDKENEKAYFFDFDM